MADIADIATESIETALANTIQNIRRFEAPSLFECEECHETIPEQRRKLGGVTLCITCQSVLEAKQKHLRGRPWIKKKTSAASFAWHCLLPHSLL